MTVCLEFAEQFVKQHHLARVHNETTQDIVYWLATILSSVEKVRMISVLSQYRSSQNMGLYDSRGFLELHGDVHQADLLGAAFA